MESSNLLLNTPLSLETDLCYKNCVQEFTELFLQQNQGNVQCILLYGGLVRDTVIYKGWSDIDILVIFRDITNRCPRLLASLLSQLYSKYSIRIDLSQITQEEITDPCFFRHFYNSEIMNALALHEEVSAVIFGEVPSIFFSPEQEQQAAIYYISNTLHLFRRYLVEALFNPGNSKEAIVGFQRVVRWSFSIIRTSLRLFGIHTHPYQYCIPYVQDLFPDLDVALLLKLNGIRTNAGNATLDLEICTQLENFLNNYVKKVLRKYRNEKEMI